MPILKRLAGPAISLIALSAVVMWALGQETPSFPTSAASLALLVVGLGLYGVASLLRGYRWHKVLLRTDIEHDPKDAYALVSVGYMGNTVLPARGGEVLRMVLLADRSNTGKRNVLGSILAERVVDGVALVLLFVTLTWFGVAGAPTGQTPAAIAAGAVLLAAVAVPGYLRLRKRGMMKRFADLFRPFSRPSRLMLSRFGVAMLGLTILVWGCEGAIVYLIGEAMSVDVQPIEALFVIVLASFFAMIPSAPGFVGTFDAAVVFGLEAVGVPGGQALGAAVLLRFILFVPITFAGMAFMVTRYGGFRELRRRRG
jgi:glycosyltransferase 2 family protein